MVKTWICYAFCLRHVRKPTNLKASINHTKLDSTLIHKKMTQYFLQCLLVAHVGVALCYTLKYSMYVKCKCLFSKKAFFGNSSQCYGRLFCNSVMMKTHTQKHPSQLYDERKLLHMIIPFLHLCMSLWWIQLKCVPFKLSCKIGHP